jgi:hypothetical protein
LDARRVLSVAAVALAVASCFSDLPPAASCPAEPRRTINDCLPTLGQAVQSGAQEAGRPLVAPVHECVLGTPADCSNGPTCGASQCPDSASACSPAPDCPDFVRKSVPSATCLKAARADVTELVCGCASCLAVCDGFGPTMGVLLPKGSPPALLFSINLGSALPASGKLGVYARLRGAPHMTMQVVHDASFIGEQRDVSMTFDTQFRDVILSPEMVSWSSADRAPTTIRFVAAPGSDQAQANDPGITFVQIDCVVPFLAR